MPRELWAMPTTCTERIPLPPDTIRYLPKSPSLFKGIPQDIFTDLELACGISEALLEQRRPLVGTLVLPGASVEAAQRGLLPWSKTLKEDELYSTYLPESTLSKVFRHQSVDLGLDLIYETDERTSVEWTASFYGSEHTPLLSQTIKEQAYPSCRMIRLAQWILQAIPTVPLIGYSRPEIANLFVSRIRRFIFFQINASADAAGGGMSMDDVKYLYLSTPKTALIKGAELVIRPRLAGRSKYLATFPLPVFVGFSTLMIVTLVPPLFLMFLCSYTLSIAFIIPRVLRLLPTSKFFMKNTKEVSHVKEKLVIEPESSTPSRVQKALDQIKKDQEGKKEPVVKKEAA